MIEYFKKLDIDLSDINLEDTNSGASIHNPQGLDFHYYKIKPEYFSTLKSRLPKEYQEKLYYICYCIIKGPTTIYPHKDKRTVTAINYYFKLGPSETSFFEFKNSNPRYAVVNDKVIEGSYVYDDVEKVTSFSAKPHECYILNTSALHDVQIFSNKERHFINYIFQQPL